MDKSGGPAFPVPEQNYLSDGTYSNVGMTLRDWFAGQAFPAVYADLCKSQSICQAEIIRRASERSFEVAGAMLAAREGAA